MARKEGEGRVCLLEEWDAELGAERGMIGPGCGDQSMALLDHCASEELGERSEAYDSDL